jgi:hypothetical protein
VGQDDEEPQPPEGKGKPEGETPESDRQEEEAFRAKVRHYARRSRLFRG